jgi:hypothetical protein
MFPSSHPRKHKWMHRTGIMAIVVYKCCWGYTCHSQLEYRVLLEGVYWPRLLTSEDCNCKLCIIWVVGSTIYQQLKLKLTLACSSSAPARVAECSPLLQASTTEQIMALSPFSPTRQASDQGQSSSLGFCGICSSNSRRAWIQLQTELNGSHSWILPFKRIRFFFTLMGMRLPKWCGSYCRTVADLHHFEADDIAAVLRIRVTLMRIRTLAFK